MANQAINIDRQMRNPLAATRETFAGFKNRSVLNRACDNVARLAVDGHENTQPNADGILPSLMEEAGFAQVQETAVIPTLTGSLSLYKAIRPLT